MYCDYLGCYTCVLSINPFTTVQLPTVEKDTPTSRELLHRIKLRARDLVIPQSNRKWAVDLVNDLRDNLLDFLKNNDEQPFFQSAYWLTSGSYYEMVKVGPSNSISSVISISCTVFNCTEEQCDCVENKGG